ncbi:hypothetical protein ACFL0Q_02995 [Thermodesulfobacteriota bacterium]
MQGAEEPQSRRRNHGRREQRANAMPQMMPPEDAGLLAGGIPGSKLHTVEGAGHGFLVETISTPGSIELNRPRRNPQIRMRRITAFQ